MKDTTAKMEAFKVFHKPTKTFLNDDDFHIDIWGRLARPAQEAYEFRLTYLNDEEYEYFKDTELKDINGKPIYADSSIVEFNYIGDDYKKYYFIGWIEFNIEEQRSKINILNDQQTTSLWYKAEKISNLQIRDTIQENKLDLIKDLK